MITSQAHSIIRNSGKKPPPPRVNPYAQYLTPKVEHKPSNQRMYTEVEVREMFKKLIASVETNKQEITAQIVANGKRQLNAEAAKLLQDVERHLDSLREEEERLEAIRNQTKGTLEKVVQAAPEQLKQREAELKRAQTQLLIANKIREFLESHVDLTNAFPSPNFPRRMGKELQHWASMIEEKSDRLRDAEKMGRVIAQKEITTLLSTIDPLVTAISEYASQLLVHADEVEDANKARTTNF